MNHILKRNILILIYSIFATIYLFATINNFLDNPNGNRTLGAFLAFGYFLCMIIGLIKLQHFFALLSAFNFLIVTVIIFWIQLIVFPKIYIGYIIASIFTIFGLLLSIKLMQKNHKISN